MFRMVNTALKDGACCTIKKIVNPFLKSACCWRGSVCNDHWCSVAREVLLTMS